LRLFEEVRRNIVRYVGAFRLDAEQAYCREDAPDTKLEMRSVLVFKLWPLDGAPAVPPKAPVVSHRTVPLEAHLTETFTANPATGQTNAERRESACVTRYGSWLAGQGHTVVRNEIRLPGQARALYSDLFDQTEGELVEAKGSASREHVRLALGQVLDYARYVEHRSLGVLLPVRPADDLVELLADHSVHCIYETTRGDFERSSTPK
jgi:hypothetical protein